MGYTVIAPVGDNPKALFIGMKEFPTERVVLISPKSQMKTAHKLQKQLEDFTIDTEIIEIKSNMMEDMFSAFGKVLSARNPDDVVVNVATGDRMSTCAALSAAYANGLMAFGVMGRKTMLLPVMKLAYYEQLSTSKLRILKQLSKEEFTSSKDLSLKLDMSSSLLHYHINGNPKYKGLAEFRLVEIKEEGVNQFVKLSTLGDLLLKGYIDCENCDDD